MKPYQERVVIEKKELDDKRAKLTNFMNGDIYLTLDKPEQYRLTRQLDAMNLYASMLGERISAFAP